MENTATVAGLPIAYHHESVKKFIERMAIWGRYIFWLKEEDVPVLVEYFRLHYLNNTQQLIGLLSEIEKRNPRQARMLILRYGFDTGQIRTWKIVAEMLNTSVGMTQSLRRRAEQKLWRVFEVPDHADFKRFRDK